MKVRAHLYISGKVQGVSYRWFTVDVANSLKLAGWVKNLGDGRVEAVIEGKRADIEKAIMECRQGPPGALVIDVEVRWEDQFDGFTDFEIRH